MKAFLRVERSEGLNLFQELVLRWLLPKLTGRMSFPLFLIECRRRVGSPLEGIFYRVNRGRKEVLLKRRPVREGDVYSGKLDVFGTVMLSTDVLTREDPDWRENCYKLPFQRILAEAGLTKLGSKPRVATSRLFMGDRGPVNQTVMLCTVPEDEKPNGEWYAIDELPEDLIWEHHSLIALAAEYM